MTSGGQFDPFNQARLPAPPLEGKSEERLVEIQTYYMCSKNYEFVLLFNILFKDEDAL